MSNFVFPVLLTTLLSGCFSGLLTQPDPRAMSDLAEYYFNKKEYAKCIDAAREALAVNPNQWQAHEWIEESQRIMESRQGRTLAVFYTGNDQGVYVASSDQPLGGLPRRAGLLSALRERYPYSVTVDAGNFLSPRNAEIKRNAAFTFLKKMGYDALNLGAGEWALGLDTISRQSLKASVTVVASNSGEGRRRDEDEAAGKGIVPLHQVEPGGKFLVSILGVLTPPSGSDEVKALRPLIDRVRLKSDVVILLAAASFDSCRRYAQELPKLDVIICGASETLYHVPDTIGNTVILSPGARGEYLGLLLLKFSPTRRWEGFENRLIPLDETVPEDAGLHAALKGFLITPPTTITDNSESPWLPFVSSEDATLLKRARSRASDLMDSLAQKKLPATLAADSAAVDSMKKIILKKKGTAFAESLAVLQEERTAREKGDTTAQVYLRNLSTMEIDRVSWNPRENGRPLMNAAQTSLFYFADTLRRGKVESDLCVYNIATHVNDRVTAGRGNTISSATWGADGKSVYYILRDTAGIGELFIKRPWKNVVYNLSRTPGLSEETVTASPDGRNIAFTRREENGMTLYLAGPAGERPVAVAASSGDCFSPAFSGHGRYLAYLFNRHGQGEGFGDLYLITLSSGKKDTIMQNSRVRELLWNGDDQLILVSGFNYTDLSVMEIPSGATRKLIQRDDEKPVSERHPRLVRGKKGRLILCYEVENNGRLSPAAADFLTGESASLVFKGVSASIE